MFTRGEGFATFLSVAQDSTGNAKEIAKALAMAMGSKKGAIEVSFEDETYLDLMSEQGTWPLIMKVMYEVYRFLVDQGHPEEAVLMELYLSKEAMFMMEKMADDGVFKQLPYHSNTSQYGQLSGFDKVDSTYIRKFVEDTYNRIKGDAFDQEWQDIQKNGNVRLAELKDAAYKSDLTLSEERVKARLS
jgi:ketol-acid reductoisomerase